LFKAGSPCGGEKNKLITKFYKSIKLYILFVIVKGRLEISRIKGLKNLTGTKRRWRMDIC
jgi:hypothetical protein